MLSSIQISSQLFRSLVNIGIIRRCLIKQIHNRDHFPSFNEQSPFCPEDHNPKWKLKRANWDLISTRRTGKLIPENFKESSDSISDFTSPIIEISKECITQTSTNQTKSNPWYNDDR